MNRLLTIAMLLFGALGARTASAHISYSGRNLGTFNVVGTLVTGSNNNGSLTSSGTSASVTITNQNVATDYGWAAGTDARFGDSHELRAFRFTLQSSAIVSITVVGLTYTAGDISFLPLENPGISIYQGLAHVAPNALDHDQSAISVAYLTSIVGAGNFDGAFNALGNWKIGSDDGTTFADLTSFTYIGNAADGTSANYGSAVGINGDGNADGSVTATFSLGAGDYTIFVGGGNYAGTSSSSYGLQTTFTVVPEPAPWALLLGGAVFLAVKLRFRGAIL